MKHLGDITKLNGSEVPLTEIVVGGSPCQDLSVAGKRAGLAGARSGLFMEQIRLIKEMRNESFKQLSIQGTVDPSRIIPRFMVWENVPGAFSSNNGEDFRAVLEETARVKDKDAAIPRLEGKQKWSPSGCIMGDGWSIAWRVHDAQFWGVPQRRKRIALVADFAGGAAPEILFERKSMSGNSSESGEERKGTAEDAERSIGETSIACLNDQGGSVMGVSENVTGALRAQEHGHQPAVCYGISSYESNAMKSANPHSGVYEAETSRTLDLNGGSPACNQGGMAVVQAAGVDTYNQTMDDEIAQPLRAADGGDSTPKVVCLEGNGSRPSHKGDGYAETDTMYTLNSTEHHAVCKIYSMGHDIRSAKFTDDEITDPLTATDYKDPIKINDCRRTYQDITGTLDCGITKGTGNQLANNDMFIANTSVVRRLTPLECERLQGYPDGWTNIGEWVDSKGKKHKDADSPRYKALGNSIALPFWQWMAERMVRLIKNDEPEKEPTMASLFSGIGGFELVFARAGVKPVWNSEIESYPEAVTRVHFGDDERGIKGDYEKYL